MITYNHENFIRESIEGILMQKCDFDIELILSNDCSTDSTDAVIQDILQNHPKSFIINYLRHRKNLGMMPNFIETLKQCNGKYIALCEGDDFWTDPLKLQKQVDFLEGNDDYVLCFHQVNILKTNGEIVDDFITIVPENHETIESLVRLGNYIHTPSVVFRNVIKTFPFEFFNVPFGDFFLYFLLAEKGKLKYLDEKMCVYRHGVGVVSQMSRLEIANNNVQLYSCMISHTNNEEVKKILFERQIDVVTIHFNQIAKGPKYYFVSNHMIFKWINFLRTENKNPLYILNKLKQKLFQKK